MTARKTPAKTGKTVEPVKKPATRRPRKTPDKPPMKPGPGEPHGLTLTKLINLTNLVAGGNYITTACSFVGISEAVYHKWRRRGETEYDRLATQDDIDIDTIMERFEGKDPTQMDDKGLPMERSSAAYMWANPPAEVNIYEWPFVVFRYQQERARAAAEIRIIQNIHAAAAAGQWQAGMTWLERTMPDKYGRRDNIHLQGAEAGSPVRVEQVVTVDQINAALAKLLDD